MGFGDAVTPAPVDATFPTLLDTPPPVVRVYPKETVVAEKLQAMVLLGMLNSRMKDFYDLAHLARHPAFEGHLLVEAVRTTFDRRGTPLPAGIPVGLTEQFVEDGGKRAQWAAFVGRSRLGETASL
ncbi:MAG: nucleotidyl transferase AbiEii/AbiGii toxin family protein, partial [Bacteroidota bacterium]